jgi:hypothetical protein
LSSDSEEALGLLAALEIQSNSSDHGAKQSDVARFRYGADRSPVRKSKQQVCGGATALGVVKGEIVVSGDRGYNGEGRYCEPRRTGGVDA